VELGPLAVLAALIAGVLAGERAGIVAANSALIVGAGALGAAWFVRPPFRGLLAAIACALLGCAAMGRALDGQAHSPLRTAIEQHEHVTIHGEATSDPSGPTFEASVLVRVDAGRGARRTLLASASGNEAAAVRVIEAGDHVVLEGRLRPLGGGAYDDRAKWRHAVGRFDGVRVVELSAPHGLPAVANSIRAEILRGTRSLAPTPRALVAGFLLGDTRAVPVPVIDAYRDSGLSHLLAVSGEKAAIGIGVRGRCAPDRRQYVRVRDCEHDLKRRVG
jgi:competence protein ComEC